MIVFNSSQKKKSILPNIRKVSRGALPASDNGSMVPIISVNDVQCLSSCNTRSSTAAQTSGKRIALPVYECRYGCYKGECTNGSG